MEYGIPGTGELGELCLFVKGYMSCPGGHYTKPIKYSCQRVECPECYINWSSKAARRITDVLRGAQDAYRNSGNQMIDSTDWQQMIKERRKVRRINHFVLSPDKNWLKDGECLNSVYKRLYLFLKRNGMFTGGFVVYHPYRIKGPIRVELQQMIKNDALKVNREYGGLWDMVHKNVLGLCSWRDYVYFSPHFHLLSFGGLPRADILFAKTGWVYKNLGKRDNKIYIDEKGVIIDEVKRTAQYLLTHCCVQYSEKGRIYKTYRFYGLCSPSRLRVQKEAGVPVIRKVYKSVLKCPVCGAELVHCAPIEEGYYPLYDNEGLERTVKTKLVFRNYEVIK